MNRASVAELLGRIRRGRPLSASDVEQLEATYGPVPTSDESKEDPGGAAEVSGV